MLGFQTFTCACVCGSPEPHLSWFAATRLVLHKIYFRLSLPPLTTSTKLHVAYLWSSDMTSPPIVDTTNGTFPPPTTPGPSISSSFGFQGTYSPFSNDAQSKRELDLQKRRVSESRRQRTPMSCDRCKIRKIKVFTIFHRIRLTSSSVSTQIQGHVTIVHE